jgi:hypothetical protein
LQDSDLEGLVGLEDDAAQGIVAGGAWFFSVTGREEDEEKKCRNRGAPGFEHGELLRGKRRYIFWGVIKNSPAGLN